MISGLSGLEWDGMSDIEFLGSYEHTFDSKGRISVPAKFREVLADRYTEEKLIVTPDLDSSHCLFGFPSEVWRQVGEKRKAYPTLDREMNDLFRHVYSNAEECPLDRQGRILVPSTLRAYAGIAREAILIGFKDRIEIWDRRRWKEKESEFSQDSRRLKATQRLASLGM